MDNSANINQSASGISRDISNLKRAEQELKQYRNHLEELVKERTEEITRINVCLSDEVIERKRVEHALRVGEEQYRLLAENVRNGVVIVQEEKIIFANEVFASMLGCSVDLLLQNDPVMFFTEHNKGIIGHLLTSDDAEIPDSPWQTELIRSDGSSTWVEIERSSIVWNTQAALLLTVRDINQSKLREIRLEEERVRLRQENLMFKSTIRDRFRFGELIGKSLAMQRVYELIVSAATSDINVLICGESGTGKELIARTIHQVSTRKNHAFVPVNCASIPETLFEREFFGHHRGAFTGADRDQPGFFDRAHRGVLFLDEVTELTPGMQAKLLRVLQDGEYIPLGSTTAKLADVMIVAATNRSAQEEIVQGRLRKDFFYRIGVIEITVPPLQERKEDLPLLVEHILDLYLRKQMEIHGSTPHDLPVDQTMLPGELVQALYNYTWPGNVRELQNILQRYLATNDHMAILNQIDTPRKKLSISDVREIPTEATLPEALESFEKQMIHETLAQTSYNTQQAAEKLGIPLHTLYRRIKRYRLMKKDYTKRMISVISDQ